MGGLCSNDRTGIRDQGSVIRGSVDYFCDHGTQASLSIQGTEYLESVSVS